MPKTPDDIKKGMECCAQSKCGLGECSYYSLGGGSKCIPAMCADALALIQQLQQNNAQLAIDKAILAAENAEKDVRIQQLEAERDAAVADIGEMVMQTGFIACDWCDHCDCESGCSWSSYNPGFKWRGVQKEE